MKTRIDGAISESRRIITITYHFQYEETGFKHIKRDLKPVTEKKSTPVETLIRSVTMGGRGHDSPGAE